MKFLDVGNIGLRVFHHLYHIHRIKNFSWIYHTTVPFTLLQSLVQQVYLRFCMLHHRHIIGFFGKEPVRTILISTTPTHAVGSGHSISLVACTPTLLALRCTLLVSKAFAWH